MALIIIKNTLKISGVLSVLVMQGCVSEAAYYAHEAGGESFSLNDKYLRVDPLNYPIFAMKEDREAPVNLNSLAMRQGRYRHPDLLEKYKWEITHTFNSHYLAYSKSYDYQYCSAHMILNRSSPNICEDSKAGASNNIYVYLKKNGEAYGFQFLRNAKRWLFPSDKVSFFDVKDYGDWSGQPWFECVERCDKLVNMK